MAFILHTGFCIRILKGETIMICYLLILAISISNPKSLDLRHSDFDLSVTINSNIYTYRLKNTGSETIVGIELPQHAAYNFICPQGWIVEATSDKAAASVLDSQKGIHPYQEGIFSMRVSSRGAVLGAAPITVHFQSGRSAAVPDVWVPVPEPSYYRFTVAAIVLSLVFYHGWAWRKRRTRTA